MEKRLFNILFFVSLPRFIKYNLLNFLKVDRLNKTSKIRLNSSKFFCLSKEENLFKLLIAF